jgi:signal transduction histidine kinase
MRRLLAVLRDSDDELSRTPQPSLLRLDALAEQLHAAGLRIDLDVSGDPDGVPPGVDLSGYRIVQEALTNIVRHADAAQACVQVRFRDSDLEICVTNDGAARHPDRGDGHGLLGIRERVAVVGGQMDAGPRPDGGFRVRARLPYAVP